MGLGNESQETVVIREAQQKEARRVHRSIVAGKPETAELKDLGSLPVARSCFDEPSNE